MRDYEEFEKHGFNDMQIEVLQEISNIGVGHAATALSQLLHRRVDMSVPYVEILSHDKVGERLVGANENLVASILVHTKSFEDKEKSLTFLLIFGEDSVKNILDILKHENPPDDITKLDEISHSIIEETGNILLLHTITAINSFSGTRWFPSTPETKIDNIGAITNEIVGKQSSKDIFLLVECDVFTDEEKLKGIILIIPNDDALHLIMSKLYGEDFVNMME